MTQFLFETLLWTGVLIGVVLLLRRPVAKHLGPQAAYALWLLPALRLVMPPLVLPAWLKPQEALVANSNLAATDTATPTHEVIASVSDAGTPQQVVSVVPIEPTMAR